MQTKVHLVSMPWADPELPSIQTAVLKAFLDAAFGRRVTTRTYSAFASILLRQTREGCANLMDEYRDYEEYPYFLLYARRWLRHDPQARGVSQQRVIDKINGAIDTDAEPLTSSKLERLERRTCRYVDETIVPQLTRRGVNLVGFTLNYYQLYASLYCARYLQERCPDAKFVFVYGGATVIYPKVAEVLERLGVEGICVIGEGERKLELIVREILATPRDQYATLLPRLAALHEGIYDIRRRTLDLYDLQPGTLLELQTPVDTLPLPDFDEYYASLRRVFTDAAVHAEYKSNSWLSLEGTRGCFAHCDFCDVHTSWSGFRKSSAERIVDRVLALAAKHRIDRIKFMDNVCDTWAERYAEILIERKLRITAFMECRVHHPEVYWTKLALAGVEAIQVGIEALSPSLIRAMNKGTRAKQNLLVQKWLKELGIESLSNVISHHPKSTLREVEETKHVLRLIPHLDELSISNLALLIGSPLDGRVPLAEKSALEERQPFDLPKGYDRYFVLKGEYDPPDAWFAPGVLDAWDELVEWRKTFAKTTGDEPFMTATRYRPDAILVRDGRYGRVDEHHLLDDTARVYQLCHRGPTLDELSRDTELAAPAVEAIVTELADRRLLVELDGCYVALALRPRDELVHNYVEQAIHDRLNPPRRLAHAS